MPGSVLNNVAMGAQKPHGEFDATAGFAREILAGRRGIRSFQLEPMKMKPVGNRSQALVADSIRLLKAAITQCRDF